MAKKINEELLQKIVTIITNYIKENEVPWVSYKYLRSKASELDLTKKDLDTCLAILEERGILDDEELMNISRIWLYFPKDIVKAFIKEQERKTQPPLAEVPTLLHRGLQMKSFTKEQMDRMLKELSEKVSASESKS